MSPAAPTSATSAAAGAPVARLAGVGLRYGKTRALDGIDLDLPAGAIIGLIGPDGVGKSSLLSLIAGARRVQRGSVTVLGGDMTRARQRSQVCPRIAYMPQGLGRNLYPTLSIEENLQFFARLFGHDAAERRRRIDTLTGATGLREFLDRPVGKLSGGMRQKLGLCCALIHDPDLMVLDEPTTGVDPLARSQFWALIASIRAGHPGLTVIVATAYMEEADRFDWLVALEAGRLLAVGTPQEFRARTGTDSLEAAFIQLLPEERRRGHQEVQLPPLVGSGEGECAIEARDLTKRFDGFTAVDHVNLRIRRGEIFGFIGSNGCGKTTTMKMLTGLLPASEGRAWLLGHEVNPHDLATRRRVGYMSQSFSLYAELTVRQNLELHARLFHVAAERIPGRVATTLERFGLAGAPDVFPDTLPLGLRQRLSLAVAMVHEPELLILDEPTSGVDPIARDQFWQLMIDLARRDQVTIFISTHFMNEAARCDRISLMHAGKILVSATPAEIVRERGAVNLEQAFINHLQAASPAASLGVNPAVNAPAAEPAPDSVCASVPSAPPRPVFMPIRCQNELNPLPVAQASSLHFEQTGSLRYCLTRKRMGISGVRAFSYTLREALELRRDPLRAALALIGSLLLMLIMAYGMSMDVENLKFAVLDRDATSLSRAYALNLAGSRYFIEQRAITDDADLDRRMRSGELALAIEIPPGFARDFKRGAPVAIGAWIDGAMPQRAETVRGYVSRLHQDWLIEFARYRLGQELATGFATVETRFRYNPDVTSLPAMVPAVIPMLLLLIPAMLTALSVVREKELGSIINFYVTPVTRTEFLLGKQAPYVVLGLLNFLLMVLMAVTVFGVPLKGSFATLALAALIFVFSSTGMGLLASVFTRSQIAAMFFTMVGTMIPVVEFAGLLNPVSALQGTARVIGEIYPATHMLIISRGVFGKALGFADLHASFLPLALAVPVIFGLSIALLRKQAP